jgi:hypothetical protein
MTLGIYTHVGIHDLARGLDGLAHTLPTPCVSKRLTGTHPAPVKYGHTAPRRDTSRHAVQSTEPKVTGSNPVGCTEFPSDRLAHPAVATASSCAWRLVLRSRAGSASGSSCCGKERRG